MNFIFCVFKVLHCIFSDSAQSKNRYVSRIVTLLSLTLCKTSAQNENRGEFRRMMMTNINDFYIEKDFLSFSFDLAIRFYDLTANFTLH